MTELLILKDVAYSAKIGGGVISGINEVNLLAAGAIAYFDDSNNMLTAAIAAGSLLDDKSVYFAVGSGDAATGAKISQKVNRSTGTFNKKAYVAPVKPVKFIGFNGATGTLFGVVPSAGTVLSIRITRQDIVNPLNLPNDKVRYDYVVKAGDTAIIIQNALVAKINANTNSSVVAVGMGGVGGIQLTAKNFEETFEIGVADGLAYATITEAAAPATLLVLGFGTPSQILKLESYFDVEEGHTNKVLAAPRNTWKVPSAVDTAETYDVYTISWRQDNGNPTGVNVGVATKEIMIAMPNGAAAITQANFETAMTVVFNGGTADAPEAGA